MIYASHAGRGHYLVFFFLSLVLYLSGFEFLDKLDFVSIAQFLSMSVSHVFSTWRQTFHNVFEHTSTYGLVFSVYGLWFKV